MPTKVKNDVPRLGLYVNRIKKRCEGNEGITAAVVIFIVSLAVGACAGLAFFFTWLVQVAPVVGWSVIGVLAGSPIIWFLWWLLKPNEEADSEYIRSY